MIIFFDHPHNKIVITRLQSIWQKIIAKILGVQKSDSRWRNLLREFIRERIFSFIITIIFRIVHEIQYLDFVNYSEIEAFFKLTSTEKEIYKNLTKYLEVQGDYSKYQMENDLLSVLRIKNLLIQATVFLVLASHTIQFRLEFLPFLKQFLEEARKARLPNFYVHDVALALMFLLNHEPMSEQEILDLFVYTIEICHRYYARYRLTRGMNDNRLHVSAYAPNAIFLGPYIFYQYYRTGIVKTHWLEKRISEAISNSDIPFFDVLINGELPLAGIELRQPQSALEALAMFFNSRNAEVSQMIQAFLARLRIHYPDKVDDFLEDQKAPYEFRLQVQTNEPTETIGGLIGSNRINLFFLYDIVIGSPMLRVQLIRILEKAVECKNAQEWLNYIIRKLINLVYGGEVLHQSE